MYRYQPEPRVGTYFAHLNVGMHLLKMRICNFARTASCSAPAWARTCVRCLSAAGKCNDSVIMDISEMSDAMDSSNSRVIGHEVKHSTRWLEFRHLRYLDPTGKERGWDMVGRTTGTCASPASATSMPDAVCVFTTLRQADREDSTLLVRQFRPPLQAETIELPAGLVDIDDQSPITTALRELQEAESTFEEEKHGELRIL